MNKKNVIFFWIRRISSKHRINLIFISLLSAATAALSVSFAVACKSVVDAAVAKDKEEFFYACIFAVIVVVSLLLSSSLSRLLKGVTQADLERNLRQDFLSKCLHKKYDKLSAYHSAELINRMSSDVSTVTDNVTTLCPDFFYYLTQLLYAGVLLLIYMKKFMLLVVPIGVVIFFTAIYLRRILKKNYSEVRKTDGEVKSFSQENFSSISVIKAFGAHDVMQDRALALMNNHRKAKIKQTLLSCFVNVCFAMIMWGSYVAAFAYCGLGILNGSITYGTLVAVQQLINKVQTPFTGLSGMISSVAMLEASTERILEIEALTDDTVADKSSQKADFGKLVINDLSFAYESGKNVLENFSMTVQKGQFTCIVGQSGVGKSTILKLILGLYDSDSGKITVYDSYGKEINTKSGIFAYVPQGNYLFTGTIRENIAFFDDNYKEDDLINASKLACAHDFIKDLPNGYDTLIGERGVGLSEGQVQRIAVARAILSGNPVLLLDESTSALDEKIEAQMLKNLRSIDGITVITITHRRAALDVCDNTVRLE